MSDELPYGPPFEICARCGARIYFNGERWAGVYLLTDGDVCRNEVEGIAHPDHEPRQPWRDE